MKKHLLVSLFVLICSFGFSQITPPTLQEVKALNETDIYISWTDNSDNEEGFVVERSY